MVHRLAVALHMMSWSVKTLTQKPHFRLGKSQKSPGARCGEYTGCGMSVIWIPTKNCCPVITMWLGALLWCRIHLVSSYLICGSSVRIAFAGTKDPLHSQSNWWLFADKHTSSLSSLKLFLHSQKLKFSDYNACLPAVLVYFWSGCTSHTQLFFKEHYPHKQLLGLQHSSVSSTRTWYWLAAHTETSCQAARTHLRSSSSSTGQTSCNVHSLPTHVHRGYGQHIWQQCCHVATSLNMSLHCQEHFGRLGITSKVWMLLNIDVFEMPSSNFGQDTKSLWLICPGRKTVHHGSK